MHEAIPKIFASLYLAVLEMNHDCIIEEIQPEN